MSRRDTTIDDFTKSRRCRRHLVLSFAVVMVSLAACAVFMNLEWSNNFSKRSVQPRNGRRRLGAKEGRLEEGTLATNAGPLVRLDDSRKLFLERANSQPKMTSFPSSKDSTVLFLHVFKCAGTTLREVFTGWAAREGGSGSVVFECNSPQPKKKGIVCLNERNELISPKRQREYVKSQKVLAGHFFWGFQQHVRKPYLMVTTLRNPLELMISAQQYMHRTNTDKLDTSVTWVTKVMQHRLLKFQRDGWDIGFLRRLIDHDVTGRPRRGLSPDETRSFAYNAITNLETFWLVGVVEQYAGFLEVLSHMLDPGNEHYMLWKQALSRRENPSAVSSKKVLENLDPGLISAFNATLSVQWEVYDVALTLWDQRCREILDYTKHASHCVVQRVPGSYA